MKKPDRGPKYRERIGQGKAEVELREITRNELVKDKIRVRLEFTKPDGRPGTRDAMNWRAARQQAHQISKELEQGTVLAAGGIRLDRVWKEWQASREEQHSLAPNHPDHLTGRTLRGDRDTGRHILAEWGRKRIDAILPIDLEQWLRRLSRSQPGTAHLCKVQLGHLFRFARRKRYLAVNPLLEDPLKLRRSERGGHWVPGWELVDRLIETGADPEIPEEYTRYSWSNLKTGIALGFGAGLRLSEILAIRWQDVDWPNGVLKIEVATTERKLPKGDKTRTVPLTQWVYEQLLDHWHVVKTRNPKHPRPAPQQDWPVIWNRINLGKPCNPSNWNGMLYGFLWRAGLIEAESLEEAKEKGGADECEWRWHCGRRFYISARFALGDPHLQIMEAVAHRDLQTTIDSYARALPEPPRIWRYRFQPADPNSRILNGQVVDGDVAQLPAPAGPEIDVGTRKNAATWIREAHRLLDSGWRLKDVCRHVGRSRYSITAQFRKVGLPPPVEVWRVARDRQYAKLYSEGVRDVDIMAQTGTSESEFYRWKLAHEAGIERGGKALTKLDKSLRKRRPAATDPQHGQLVLL